MLNVNHIKCFLSQRLPNQIIHRSRTGVGRLERGSAGGGLQGVEQGLPARQLDSFNLVAPGFQRVKAGGFFIGRNQGQQRYLVAAPGQVLD